MTVYDPYFPKVQRYQGKNHTQENCLAFLSQVKCNKCKCSNQYNDNTFRCTGLPRSEISEKFEYFYTDMKLG